MARVKGKKASPVDALRRAAGEGGDDQTRRHRNSSVASSSSSFTSRAAAAASRKRRGGGSRNAKSAETRISYFSWVVHASAIFVLGAIAYAAWDGNGYRKPGALLSTSLFSLHPMLMTLAFFALANEAVFAMSSDNIMGFRATWKQRKRFHGWVQVAAVAASAFGFLAIYENKSIHGKSHYKTWHATAGLYALGSMFLQLVIGLWLYNFPRHVNETLGKQNVQNLHSWTGYFTSIIGISAINTAILASKWAYAKIPLFAARALLALLIVGVSIAVSARSLLAKEIRAPN